MNKTLLSFSIVLFFAISAFARDARLSQLRIDSFLRFVATARLKVAYSFSRELNIGDPNLRPIVTRAITDSPSQVNDYDDLAGFIVPRCAGVDDTAILATVSVAGKPIVIPDGMTCAGRDAILAVPVKVEKGGLLKPIAGHWIRITGKFEAGPYQTFSNALSGQGTVSFEGNDKLSSLRPDWWGARADGKSDDSAAIQASLVAIRDRGRGRLEFNSTGNYKINSTVTLEALTVDVIQPIVLSGYGTTITVSTTGTPGLQIKNVTAGRSFDHWIVEGFSFVGTGTESDILSVLNTSTSFSNNWQIRDVVIQGTTGHGIHVDSSAATPGYGAFQFQISNCHIDLSASNTTKNGIYLDGPPGTVSSAELNYNTINHGKHGIETHSASTHITGGTILSAAQEGIFAKLQSGFISGVHLESNWQGAAGPGLGGGQLYIEGWCDVIGLEEYRDVNAKARWGIDIFNYGGPLNIIGRRFSKSSSTTPYVRIRNSLTTGTVNLIGIEPSEVDATAPVSAGAPYINYVGVRGDALRTSAGTVLTNGGLLIQPEGAILTVSGNSIAPTNAIHHVGAGLIGNIIVPAGFTSGTIYLIPDAAFTTVATGNIATVSTAVVGRVMVATYSSTSGKWYLSY